MMKFNKKNFFAIFILLGFQAVFGVNFSYAMPCEAELETFYSKQVGTDFKFYAGDDGVKRFDFNLNTYNGFITSQRKDKEDLKNNLYSMLKDFAESGYSSDMSCVQFAQYQAEKWVNEVPFHACLYKYMAQNSCDPSAFKSSFSAQKSKQNSSSSSNQSTSAMQSNSPESYNLQVSQTNKQNYQAMQQAYNQAMHGKGKKHNKEAIAVECMKTNPAQKSHTNKCNQPINFTYCFSGVPQGAKNENPQTLSELSCQNGQFATMTIGAGESIPGAYNGLTIQGLPCKSPSQPVDMAFDKAKNAATGRCSF